MVQYTTKVRFTGFRLLRMKTLVGTSPPHPNPLPHKLLRSTVVRDGQASRATPCGGEGTSDRPFLPGQGTPRSLGKLGKTKVVLVHSPNEVSTRFDRRSQRTQRMELSFAIFAIFC